jgi:putative transposase
MSTTYPSSLTDAEWACVQRYLPPETRRGRPRTHSLRDILDAIFYILRTGCPWRYLPANFPPWQTVFYHFRRFRLKGLCFRPYTALHAAERERVGRDVDPSAAIMDSQSVKTVEESAHIRGYDGHKCLKGRKRHLLVDTLGLPIAVYVTPGDLSDPAGARKLLAGLAFRVPRLQKLWADAAYRGKDLADWCQQQGDGWDLEIVEREPGTRGFQVQPRRWVVERCFAWLSRNRRLAKDYERRVQTSETLIEVAAARLLLRRLGSRHVEHQIEGAPSPHPSASDTAPPLSESGACQAA